MARLPARLPPGGRGSLERHRRGGADGATISPRDSYFVYFYYNPVDTAGDEGALTILTDADSTPVIVTLIGNGGDAAEDTGDSDPGGEDTGSELPEEAEKGCGCGGGAGGAGLLFLLPALLASRRPTRSVIR